MVDPGRVRRKLEALARYRERLQTMRQLRFEEYEHDHAYAARYLVQASAQAAIDIANHVISSSGWRTTRDFADAFSVLEEHGVLERDLASQMRKLAGLRNLLVHVYEEIDDRLIFDSLQQDLDDLSDYAQAIASLLDSEKSLD
jgi:uncharacterized protein YutE (UPF0331/DUF86 family)